MLNWLMPKKNTYERISNQYYNSNNSSNNNLNNFRMKKTSNIDWVKITSYGIILVLTIILATGSCSHPKPIEIPAVSGTFKPQKPIVIHDTVTEIKYKTRTLIDSFTTAPDTVKIKMYADATKINKFNSTFENDTIKIDINGVVQGEVKEITPSYTIKKRTIEVKHPETYLRLLGGLELGNTTKLDRLTAKANLMFQNRKGNVYSISYDTQKNIWIGVNWLIFDIKR